MAKLNGKGKAATGVMEGCSRKSSLNPPVKLLCNWACNTYRISFLLQPPQDPEAVSWVLFTAEETQCFAAGPGPGGHYGIAETTDFFFAGLFFLTQLPQASVVALCTI